MAKKCKKAGCLQRAAKGMDHCLSHAAMMMARSTGGKAHPGARLAFLRKALKTDTEDCILFPFTSNEVSWLGKKKAATRVMCMLASNEPMPEGMWALHKCGNGHLFCVNPKHLYWGTPKDNGEDASDHARHGKQDATKLHGEHIKAARVKTGIPDGRRMHHRRRKSLKGSLRREEVLITPTRKECFDSALF